MDMAEVYRRLPAELRAEVDYPSAVKSFSPNPVNTFYI
jgi:hypothetical protein